uniref:Uncharacterized protein n=1 Tax=Rhizophora mucronata TaxID=61149 RepID=A0A2P2QXI8_RHIMU
MSCYFNNGLFVSNIRDNKNLQAIKHCEYTVFQLHSIVSIRPNID